jgi:UDP-N-acetylmuramyl pentapeptide synthase
VSYSLGDVPALLRTPVGRAKLGEAAYCHAWPLLSRLASAYRRGLTRKTRLVAVVGSFGKTTTTRAVAAALGRPSDPNVRHNFSTYLAEALLRIRPSDPHAVIEVGIRRPGEMERYARLLRPDLAVVTSVGSEHNHALGCLESTRAEKAEMVRALPPSGLAVLNRDDPNVCWMAGQTAAQVRTFGFGSDSDVCASEVVLEWPRGTRFKVTVGGQVQELRTKLIGRPMVYAILAAVTVALAEGLELAELVPRLEQLEPTPGRLQAVGLANGAFLLRDDFKSTLETIDAALDVLAEIPASRRIAVLGEIDDPPVGGELHYQRLGQRLGAVADRAVIVGQEETYQQYAAGARMAGLGDGALLHAGQSVHRAAELLGSELRPGDAVLVKGRWAQRLDRVALALAGRRVGCEATYCSVRRSRCDHCPMLEQGWRGRPVRT